MGIKLSDSNPKYALCHTALLANANDPVTRVAVESMFMAAQVITCEPKSRIAILRFISPDERNAWKGFRFQLGSGTVVMEATDSLTTDLPRAGMDSAAQAMLYHVYARGHSNLSQGVVRAIFAAAAKMNVFYRLPNAWYRDYEDDLVPILLKLYNICHEGGSFPSSFLAATIVCLPKAGKTDNPLGYRPIALLNTDYKVFMRQLATRLKPALPSMIAPSQGGFVPGRDVHDVIDLYAGAQRYAEEANAETVAVLLDIKKAYDSLDRAFLYECLEQRGFPASFVRAIESTHTGTTARFCVNGQLSRPIETTRGIRQGCPLAPLLFIVAMDPLYRSITADPELSEPLPDSPGLLPPCGGFADDTALYTQNEAKLGRIVEHLDAFATVSGLCVNKEKSVVVKLNPQASPIQNPHGFKVLGLDEMCRYLGIQVGRTVSQAAVWHLTMAQIEKRLAMARTKTHSLYQRAKLAAAIIVPKILYVARHHWPSRIWVKELDTRMWNFVWTGNFVESISSGSDTVRWMNKQLADLPIGAGGLGSPNIELELLVMATQTVAKWCYDPTGLRDIAMRLLSLNGAHVQVDFFSDSTRPKARHRNGPLGYRATGDELGIRLDHVIPAPAPNPGRRERSARGHGLEMVAREINRLREAEVGKLSPGWIPYMAITKTGSGILHRDGTQLKLAHLKALGEGTTISDFVEWRWVEDRTLRFQPRRPFPLTNIQAAAFIELCDTLVANFPDLTQPPDMTGKIRTYNVTPQRDMEWKWEASQLCTFEDGIQRCQSTVLTQFQLQRQQMVVVDDRPMRPMFECTPALTRLVMPWRGEKPWCPKRRRYKRALFLRSAQAGHAARQERMKKWRHDHEAIASALAVVPWHEIGRAEGLSTYDHQVWARLRHHQLVVRTIGDTKRGCTRDGCGEESADDVAHMVWDCSHAQALWKKLARFWGAPEIADDELRTAVFSRRPPNSTLEWRALFPVRDSCLGDRLDYWERTLWTQLTTCALRKLWIQRVRTATGGRDDGGRGDFYAVLHNWAQRLRSNITAVYRKGSESKTLDVDILTAFYKGMVLHTDVPPRVSTTTTEYLLFFDGGSRGNPGAGGSGSVIVRVRDEPEVVWAGSMSYARNTTTNNLAEYQGLCTGLAAAERYGWTPLEVVGDSMMIIRQMTTRRPPKAPTLRPLYEKARSIADALRIRCWHHHYRTHNKMADKAANQAMDSGTSYQALAQDARPELDELREWLFNDVNQWLQARTNSREER